ncbi:thymidylate synthase [Azospirillum rugosum]|uniref:thymidylate synthase n=1 Tax=Azospirillum rugosum TaxID=416170 RepID=UPI003670D5D7
MSFATVESFNAALRDGVTVMVRGHETKELRNRITSIARPRERCIFLPGRHNDIFAQVAETFWVIGGRNDLPWLTHYLPRAPDFSDDHGLTWHGAYGPRLRTWAGKVDQLDEWRRLLIADSNTRRAVGVLFDPNRDFVSNSNDIPCNNWLNWLLRDGQLHLNIAVRSNDAMWGFSGVNAFEWSVLHEMMAFWVGSDVGEATFFATSYHLYSRHYNRARNIVNRFYGMTPYDFGIVSPRFATQWADFSAAMAEWFEIEEQLRANPIPLPRAGLVASDPFLSSTLRLLRLKWGAKKWSVKQLASELANLPEDDFATAAYEFFGRDRPELLANITQPKIAAFFCACQAAKGGSSDTELKAAIKHLHTRKNAIYAGAWKRRGERVSVLPNIARKVDRLQAFADEGKTLKGETVLDTAIDLYVYAAKYRLFLAELSEVEMSPLGPDAPQPLSDHDKNFDALVDIADFSGDPQGDLLVQIRTITKMFEDLWQAVDAAGAGLVDRQRSAAELTAAAEQLVGLVVAADPRCTSDFLRNVQNS